MNNLLLAYQPLFDLFLLSCGLALSQYVVLRAGVFSIATVGIASLGAYTATILTMRYGLGLVVTLPAATLVGLAAGVALSVPLARLRGPYQAIATLAFVQIVASIALYAEDLTGGAMGINNIPKTVGTWSLLIAVGGIAYFMLAISSTGIGRAFDAVRQDETVAGALGVSPAYYHALAFAISGAIAGLFGALQSAYLYTVEPNQFGFQLLTTTLAAVILGGRQSVAGPIVGAAIMAGLPEIARPLTDNRLLLNGLLLMFMIAHLPHGIVDGLLMKWRRDTGRSPLTQRAAESRR
jgi:branched-chain amino acid transport system permease protein